MNCNLNIASQSLVALTLMTASASAAFITDGSLRIDVRNNGEFSSVSLNATEFYTDYFFSPMIFYFDGNTGNSRWVQGSAVVVNGPSATYLARTGNGIDVAATVRILGPLASKPVTSSVLEHEYVFTNNTSGALPLAPVFGTDPNLSYSSQPIHDYGFPEDVAAYDAATRSVFLWSPVSTKLVATIALDPAHQAAFGFDVAGFFGFDEDPVFPDRTFPIDGNVGPVGMGDMATTIGLNYGRINPGQTVTAIFRHLFDTDATTVPPDFTFVPEPQTWVLLSLSGFAWVWRGRLSGDQSKNCRRARDKAIVNYSLETQNTLWQTEFGVSAVEPDDSAADIVAPRPARDPYVVQ